MANPYKTALYKNTRDIVLDETRHNQWHRIAVYGSTSGASVAINGVKNGTATYYQVQPKGKLYAFAFTARIQEGKSYLYAYLITQDAPAPKKATKIKQGVYGKATYV